jgi:hypothetical protein
VYGGAAPRSAAEPEAPASGADAHTRCDTPLRYRFIHVHAIWQPLDLCVLLVVGKIGTDRTRRLTIAAI